MLAINDVGEGPLSEITTVKAASVPATIETLQNTDSATTPSLTYSWVAPSSHGAVIFNYIGELQNVATGTTQVWSGGGTDALPYTATTVVLTGLGLVAGEQFKFRVAGVNEMGTAAWSDWSSLTDPPRGFALDKPITPTSFGRHSDPATAGRIKLGWDAIGTVADAGGDQVSGVKYEVWGGHIQTAMTQRVMSSDTDNFYEEVIPAGQKVYYRARTLNSGGIPSIWTSYIQVPSAEVPTQAVLRPLTSTEAGKVIVEWNIPVYDGSSPITRYEVTNDNWATIIEVANTEQEFIYFGQSANAYVTYLLRAYNAVGASPVSSQTILVCCSF